MRAWFWVMGIGVIFVLLAHVGWLAAKRREAAEESGAPEPEALPAPRYVSRLFSPNELWLEDGRRWIEIGADWYDLATGDAVSREERIAAFMREHEGSQRAKVAKYRRAGR